MDSNFWYFTIQTLLELIGIGIGIWFAIRFYLEDQRNHWEQFGIALEKISLELRALQDVSNLVTKTAMTYLTTGADKITVEAIENRKLAEIERVKQETLQEIRLVINSMLQQNGLQQISVEASSIDNQLDQILDKSMMSVSQEADEAVKLLNMNPIRRNILVVLTEVSSDDVEKIASRLSSKYPTEVLESSLKMLEEMGMVQSLTQGNKNQVYKLTNQGASVKQILHKL